MQHFLSAVRFTLGAARRVTAAPLFEHLKRVLRHPEMSGYDHNPRGGLFDIGNFTTEKRVFHSFLL
jgi:hypothetical protein